jgi:formate/nitrite transporter FocA (FNT family)
VQPPDANLVPRVVMPDRTPEEIWAEGLDEGQRRLERHFPALAATGFAGGADVMFGILAVAVSSGALVVAVPEPTAHVIASLVFGLGFAFITIGRAELFTENFLIPVGSVVARRAPARGLLRMWGITLVLNFAGLALFGSLAAIEHVLPSGALHSVGLIANTLSDRPFISSLASAVLAGVVMTVFTWITMAAQGASARILAALLIGFLLAAPTLNHAVVGFGEMFLALVAGTTHATWLDLARNVSIAILGNLIGGVGLVFATRLAQVEGKPASATDSRSEAAG